MAHRFITIKSGHKPIVFDESGLKPCSRCKRGLPRECYSADNANKVTGLQTTCKECKKAYIPPQTDPSGFKHCNSCNRDLPASSEYFHASKKASNRLNSACKKCRIADAKKWFYGHTEHAKRSRRNWKLRTKYGINDTEYLHLLEMQSGKCAICRNECDPKRRLDVDHNHITGHVRGLLCHSCNIAIGKLRDNNDIARRLYVYITALDSLTVRYSSVPQLPRINSQKRADLKRRFHITEHEYTHLFMSQFGVCLVCEKQCSTGSLLAVDHDHATGKIRGLLCRMCNSALGDLHDNPRIIAATIDYISR